jgi:uncharacterized protein YegJ (DUF2314 family)
VSVLLAAALCFWGPIAGAQQDVQTLDGDRVLEYLPAPEAAAVRKARETLPEFLALAKAPRRSTTYFAVRTSIYDGARAEVLWVSSLVFRDGNIAGKLDNPPRLLKTLKIGDTISVSENSILDWMYLDSGKIKGNFTFCFTEDARNRPMAEAMKKRGLECKR